MTVKSMIVVFISPTYALNFTFCLSDRTGLEEENRERKGHEAGYGRVGQSYRTDGPGVSSSHPLHFLSSHPHHDLVSGGDSSVSMEMENKKHPTSTVAAGNQCSVMD